MGMGPLETAVEAGRAAAPVPVVTAAGGGTYALLQCGEDSAYVRDAYGGYFEVFRALLAEDGERWRVYRAVRGELPSDEDAAGVDGFVISGSCSDAHGDEPWILALVDLVRRQLAAGKRVLGVCFGHQVLCRALGGRVGRSSSGWDVGVKEVTFVDDIEWPFEFFPLEPQPPRRASIIEVHQDEVWEVPPGGKVLAYSHKTRVEMFAVGDNALGIQGHPEYTNDILLNLTNRLVNNNTIGGCVGEEARRTAESGEPDREFWTGLCKAFLRGTGCDRAPRPPLQGPAAPELSCSHHVAHFPPTAAPIGL